MEINKENFLKEIQPIISEQVPLLLIEEGTPIHEIDAYYSNEFSKMEFLENCIDRLYLEKEYDLIISIYKRFKQLENEYSIDSKELDTILKFNVEDSNRTLLSDASLREWIDRKKEVIFSLSKYLKKYIELIDSKPQQIKEIKPIKWQKSSVLLAYLINELKKFGYIEEEGIWTICEQIFVDKNGIPIKAKTFTSMVKNYENNHNLINLNDKGKPKTHTEITELIKTLKALSKEIE